MIGQLIAREVSSHTTEKRLREVAERDFESRFFADEATGSAGGLNGMSRIPGAS
jgi:hypothetical protein